MPPKGVEKEKWERCKQKVKAKVKTWPSAYASYAVSNCYKKSGGRYKSPKKDRKQGTARWKDEEWIDVGVYAQTGRRVACGSPRRVGKACRPYRRVSPQTPMTADEVIKKHGKPKVIALSRRKSRDMKGRLNWKQGTFNSRSRRFGGADHT